MPYHSTTAWHAAQFTLLCMHLQLTMHCSLEQFSPAATLCVEVWLLTRCARTVHNKHIQPHLKLPPALPLMCMHARLYYHSRDRARPARIRKRPHIACRGILIQQHFRSTAVHLHQPYAAVAQCSVHLKVHIYHSVLTAAAAAAPAAAAAAAPTAAAAAAAAAPTAALSAVAGYMEHLASCAGRK
jgi:hypothetical protein